MGGEGCERTPPPRPSASKLRGGDGGLRRIASLDLPRRTPPRGLSAQRQSITPRLADEVLSAGSTTSFSAWRDVCILTACAIWSCVLYRRESRSTGTTSLP